MSTDNEPTKPYQPRIETSSASLRARESLLKAQAIMTKTDEQHPIKREVDARLRDEATGREVLLNLRDPQSFLRTKKQVESVVGRHYREIPIERKDEVRELIIAQESIKKSIDDLANVMLEFQKQKYNYASLEYPDQQVIVNIIVENLIENPAWLELMEINEINKQTLIALKQKIHEQLLHNKHFATEVFPAFARALLETRNPITQEEYVQYRQDIAALSMLRERYSWNINNNKDDEGTLVDEIAALQEEIKVLEDQNSAFRERDYDIDTTGGKVKIKENPPGKAQEQIEQLTDQIAQFEAVSELQLRQFDSAVQAIEQAKRRYDSQSTNAIRSNRSNFPKSIFVPAIGDDGRLTLEVEQFSTEQHYTDFVTPALITQLKAERETLERLQDQDAEIIKARRELAALTKKKSDLAEELKQKQSALAQLEKEKDPQNNDSIIYQIKYLTDRIQDFENRSLVHLNEFKKTLQSAISDSYIESLLWHAEEVETIQKEQQVQLEESTEVLLQRYTREVIKRGSFWGRGKVDIHYLASEIEAIKKDENKWGYEFGKRLIEQIVGKFPNLQDTEELKYLQSLLTDDNKKALTAFGEAQFIKMCQYASSLDPDHIQKIIKDRSGAETFLKKEIMPRLIQAAKSDSETKRKVEEQISKVVGVPVQIDNMSPKFAQEMLGSNWIKVLVLLLTTTGLSMGAMASMGLRSASS